MSLSKEKYAVDGSAVDAAHNEARLAELTDLASVFAGAVARIKSPLSAHVQHIADRLAQGRFDVAVVGEFNRGKSTLLNRLVSRGVLPSGVLPVTSVVTEIHYADDDTALLRFEDGREETIELHELDKYVTEQQNPGNAAGVASAHVGLPSPILSHGAIFVDTPGVGSIFRQSSETAREAILRADGAIMVLSADTPMTDTERSLIKLLSRRTERTFFVLNRIDHLSDPDDVEDVRWFVENVLREAFGIEQRLYVISAKSGENFADLEADIEQFLSTGLSAARVALAQRDLLMASDRIANECDVEESAMSLASSEVEERLAKFRRASDWQHEAFNDDKVLFHHAVQKLIGEMQERTVGAREVSDEAVAELLARVDDVPRAELELSLDREIEHFVREVLEPIRKQEELNVERAWRRCAERFERATQRRANKLSDIAGELFDVSLRAVKVPQPSTQRARFFYSPPVREVPQESILTKLLRPLLPERRSRARLLESGERRFREEMRRHAERMTEDLTQRVGDASAELDAAMDEQVVQVAHAMLRAIERAQSAKTATAYEHRDLRERVAELRAQALVVRERVREHVHEHEHAAFGEASGEDGGARGDVPSGVSDAGSESEDDTPSSDVLNVSDSSQLSDSPDSSDSPEDASSHAYADVIDLRDDRSEHPADKGNASSPLRKNHPRRPRRKKFDKKARG